MGEVSLQSPCSAHKHHGLSGSGPSFREGLYCNALQMLLGGDIKTITTEYTHSNLSNNPVVLNVRSSLVSSGQIM